MKIGLVQFEPRLAAPQTNIARLRVLLDGAPEADLLVLPELSNSGYNFESADQAWACSESADSGPFVSFLTEYAGRHNINIAAGVNERDGDKLYNSAVVVGPRGVLGKYRKLHLFMNEKDYFVPGDLGLPVFNLGICRIGVLICFDWSFPEVWRILMIKGADIICHPSNLVIPEKCQRAVPIHAMINGVFVITANRTGAERELSYTGRSIVANPAGEVLVAASPDREEVLVVDIDVAVARDKRITPRNDRLADRRPDVYRELLG